MHSHKLGMALPLQTDALTLHLAHRQIQPTLVSASSLMSQEKRDCRVRHILLPAIG
jgi:hypothetical protein